MSVFDFLLLVTGVLWLYSRLRLTACDYECDDTDTMNASGAHH